MFASLRLKSVRPALVVMLMVLMGVVAVQRVQSVINGVQHGLAIDHAAPILELAASDHGHAHDLNHDGDDGRSDVGDKDHAPGPHHHHSEVPQVAALTSPPTVEIAVSRSEALFMRADTGSPQSRIFGLERPPKALSHRA